MALHGFLQRGIPPQPPFLRILKIVILVLALIVLALAAYALSVFGGYWGYYGNSGVPGLLIFVCVKTFIIYGLALFLELRAAHLFFRIVGLVAYSISIVFWLSAWAWSASIAALWLSYGNDYDVCDGLDDVYCTDAAAPFEKEGGALAGCAAIGAIIWVLSIVNLIFYVRACLRDPQGTGVATHQQAELGQVKAQEAQGAPAYPQQPYQQPYPQQPYQQPYEQPQHQQPYPTQ